MRRIGMAVLAAVVVMGMERPASALIYIPNQAFNLTGTFDDGSTLGGELLIDTYTASYYPPAAQYSGTVVASFATVILPSSEVLKFDEVTLDSQGLISAGIYEVDLTSFEDSNLSMKLYLPVSTLVGYTGSSLGSLTDPLGNGAYVSLYVDAPHNLNAGSLSPAAVPEPSSLSMAIVATTAGLVTLARRRRG